MKKLFSMLLGMVMAATAGAGVMDSFDYEAGTLIGANGGTGWTNAWANNYSRNGGNYVVASTGLTHTSLTGESGNAAYSPGDGTRYQRMLDQKYESGIVYLSFLMQGTTAQQDPYSAIELQSGRDADQGRVFQIGILRADDGIGNSTNPELRNEEFYATSRSAIGGGRKESVKLSDFNTSVNLFVVRFDLDNDVAAVYFNPDDKTDLTSGGVGLSLFADFSFDRIAMANFVGANSTTIDEIRVDTVAPVLVPEPATLSMFGLAALFLKRRRA
ncbi:MAG: PEP-CTERM sorting domain-containing protein [Sedimentisphaerales bacterium]|nr:PEP-CTERM sorting domain-containing protein [Sedimentisphaerales bacterium]MBN2844340.1 PEP-CTERM sorting domain-containing protein [Sedimentisphaerales bacterium]